MSYKTPPAAGPPGAHRSGASAERPRFVTGGSPTVYDEPSYGVPLNPGDPAGLDAPADGIARSHVGPIRTERGWHEEPPKPPRGFFDGRNSVLNGVMFALLAFVLGTLGWAFAASERDWPVEVAEEAPVAAAEPTGPRVAAASPEDEEEALPSIQARWREVTPTEVAIAPSPAPEPAAVAPEPPAAPGPGVGPSPSVGDADPRPVRRFALDAPPEPTVTQRVLQANDHPDRRYTATTRGRRSRSREGSEYPRFGSIRWRNGAAAFSSASRGDRPVLLYFHASWCRSCEAIEEGLFRDGEVASLANYNFVAVRIDTDGDGGNADLVERYRVRSVPTVVAVAPGGRYRRITTSVGPARFASALRSFAH